MSKSKNPLSLFFLAIHRFVFLRKSLYSFNKALYKLSLRGLGIMNYESPQISGEEFFIKKLSSLVKTEAPVVIDIGANVGDYSISLRRQYPRAIITAFEPHPVTYVTLKNNVGNLQISTVQKACAATNGKVKFYDHSAEGSQHATLFKEVIEQLHKAAVIEYDIETITLDTWFQEQSLSAIHLLKIDTEGNEMMVLKGAKEIISKNKIGIIYFEFNEMNVVSRTFFKDIYDFLPNYNFYRLLPGSLVSLGSYNALFYEIFVLQNVVAIRKDLNT